MKIECYDAHFSRTYDSVIQVKDILEVSENHVLFNTGQIIRLTEEPAKRLQDFLLEFYSISFLNSTIYI